MVNVTWKRPAAISHAGSSRIASVNAVHVSRGIVRPVRINYPEDGSELDGCDLVMRGSGNPGDSLRLEEPGGQQVLCKVRLNGLWTMPPVRLNSGPSEMTVNNLSHPDKSARTCISVCQLPPITVASPLNGETVETRHPEVTGKAAPSRLICLRSGRSTLTQHTDIRGSFRFNDVELPNKGEQSLTLYYAENPAEGATQLTVHWPGIDFPYLVDPVTRARLEPGADIVRCTSCFTFSYKATWVRMGRCPRCMVDTDFWERPSPRFHILRPDLRGQ